MIEYRIRYTPEAIRDMDAVWDGVYEASKEPDVADRYVNDFMEEMEKKKQFPLSGVPLLYKGLFTGFYVVHFKKYKAFYRVNDSYIEVIRIIMEKMDYMKILFEESNAD
ncbi:MAG: type II toxin-antitoxin system RelE/ParE family toxin [Bacteroidales bacterium]|nr:type II toxin-antitoxin system RelE/ParE family toxin [Bacteroidales bacterium]MCM1414309.1 type II toxin-antitoxin system RelE/ParE family toxin [bacterium]MCM1422189.1 type II toxin-antitoxin system RelE/ParE family toxin [bacterium]